MIIDFANRFATAASATLATGALTNVIDLTKPGDAVKDSELYLVVRVGTACASSGGGATMTFGLESDSAEDFSTSSTKIVHATKAVAEAGLTANTIVWKLKLPPGLQRYVRVYLTESGEAFTAGTLDAFLTPDVNIA